MFITKSSVSRRTVLRGIGATLSLPLLDAMVPALTPTALTAATPTKRFGAMFVPMGERPSHWTPPTTGVNFEFSPILKPIEKFRDYVTVVSNIDRPLQGTHAVSTGTWLTGAAPKRTEAEDFIAGTSLDQIIAGADRARTPCSPRSRSRTEDQTGYVGACDVGYSCAYMNTISWKSPTTPMPMETNPRVVFERMFGRPGSAGGPAAAHAAEPQHPRLGARRRRRRSRRGWARATACGSISISSTSARSKARIQRAEKKATTELEIPLAPVGIPESWEEHATRDVRPDGAGLRGRPDARLLVHAQPRGQPARVPRTWGSTSRGTTCRITATSPRSWRCS